MDFASAARRQYRHATIYNVYLVSPDGVQQLVARTQRKSGHGLIQVLGADSVQSRIRAIPDVEDVTFRKFADRLEFSNGWKMIFGDTIRREAK